MYYFHFSESNNNPEVESSVTEENTNKLQLKYRLIDEPVHGQVETIHGPNVPQGTVFHQKLQKVYAYSPVAAISSLPYLPYYDPSPQGKSCYCCVVALCLFSAVLTSRETRI